MKIRIDHRYKPWLCAAGEKEERRPILRQVWVDPRGVMVATDTAMLAVCACEIEDAPEEFAGVLLPAAELGKLAKAAYYKSAFLEIFVDLGARTMAVATKTGQAMANLTEGASYCGWEKVSRPSLEASTKPGGAVAWRFFNPRLLAACAEAIGHGKDDPMTPIYIPEDGYIVLLGPLGESFGVVAPGLAKFAEGRVGKATEILNRLFPQESGSHIASSD